MWSKKTSGLIGIIVGGIWFMANLRHFDKQGFIAIGMPLVILTLGLYYFRKESEEFPGRSTLLLLPPLLIGVALFFSDRALSEEECLTIQKKELAELSSWSDAARDPEWVKETTRRNMALCIAGDKYTREDYQCFVSASTNEALGRCVCLESAGNTPNKELLCSTRSKP